MILPRVLFSLFLLRTILWGIKVVFINWWVERKYQRIHIWGIHKYILYEALWAFSSMLVLLLSSTYIYFTYLWMSFSIISIVLTLIVILGSTFSHLYNKHTFENVGNRGFMIFASNFNYYYNKHIFENVENRKLTDELRQKEVQKLQREIIPGLFGRGLFFVAWLKTFPILPLHIPVFQECIISVLVGAFLGAWVIRKVMRDRRQQRTKTASGKLNEHVKTASGTLNDTEKFITGLMESNNPYAFVIINIQNTEDFIQFTGGKNGVQMDFPLVTVHQQRLRSHIEEVCKQLGLHGVINTGSDGTEFLDYDIHGSSAMVAKMIKDVFIEVFQVNESSLLEFRKYGY